MINNVDKYHAGPWLSHLPLFLTKIIALALTTFKKKGRHGFWTREYPVYMNCKRDNFYDMHNSFYKLLNHVKY